MLRHGPFVSLSSALAVVVGLLAGALHAQATVTLTSADGAGGDKFGNSISLDGDVAVIGASGANIGLFASAGAAYVRRWDGSTWQFEQKLSINEPASLDAYGSRVGVRGDLCVVGVPGRKLLLKNSAGALVIYRRVDRGWVLQQTITAPDPASFDLFGGQFSLTQERLVVGVSAKDVNLKSQQGEAYVYRFDGTAFVLEAQLFASDGVAGDRFGASIDIDGEWLAVGAPGADLGAATDSGAVYIFRRTGSTWAERQKLAPSGALMLDGFGTSVALDGPVVIGGAPGADPAGQPGRGAAWVYRNNGAIFVQEQMLAAPDGLAGDAFGTSLALDGNVALIGAPKDDVGTQTDLGSAWLFRFLNGNWAGEHVDAPADISALGQFGATLAIDGGLVLIGAPNDTVGSFAVQGSASVVKTQPVGWDWVGHALAGLQGAPDLVGAGSLGAGTGTGVTLTIDDARPASAAILCISAVQITTSFKGGVLVPAPDIVLAGLPTDLAGLLVLSGLWPGGIPSGIPITYQAWVQDGSGPQGLSATNAITSTVP